MKATTPALAALQTRLGFDTIPADWPAAWERAQGSRPPELVFLQPGFIDEACAFAAISDEVRREFQAAAAVILQDPLLAQATWFLYTLYHADPMPAGDVIWSWPFVTRPPRGSAAMIAGLVVLAGVPLLRARHAARGIAETVTRANLRDIEIWTRTFQRRNGYWGYSNMGWLAGNLAGRLYRLGRLQFMHRSFAGPVHAYSHRQNGRVLALAGPGMRLRQDGFVDGTNEVTDPQAFVTALTVGEKTVTGHPIQPLGTGRPQRVTLDLAEWQPLLKPGDPILDIHIPEDGPMDFAACGESLAQAVAFFAWHFPELPPASVFFCCTWFFDAQLQQILPPTSNIVRFQREFYLYPVLSYEKESFVRVFGSLPADLNTAPRDTSLRRAMLDFTLAGNHLRSAAGFLPIAGLHWGAAKAQSGWQAPA